MVVNALTLGALLTRSARLADAAGRLGPSVVRRWATGITSVGVLGSTGRWPEVVNIWEEDGFDGMAASIERLLLDTARKERLEGEIAIARTIQQKLLPPPEAKLEGVSLVAHFAPMAEIGGDYYDYLPMPDGRVAFALGDVSGHGLPTGLLVGAPVMVAVGGSSVTLMVTVAEADRGGVLLSVTLTVSEKLGLTS